MELTDELKLRIQTLGTEASYAGDDAQVALCERALLDGDEAAIAECVRALRDAEAQQA